HFREWSGAHLGLFDQTPSPDDIAYSRATNFKHISVGYERAAQANEENAQMSDDASFKEEKRRGLIQRAWINAGKPSWDVERTVREAIHVDTRLEQESNNNPAPEFRANRQRKNGQYLRQWIRGCKFDWLRGK